MYELMIKSYFGIEKESFTKDLLSKDKILIISNSEKIIGFTSFKFHQFTDPETNNYTLTVCFSGDTVVDKQFRGDLSLPIQWGLIMLKESIFRKSSIYWLLTTKGIRTYRYLPVFFHSFYPSPFFSDPKLKRYIQYFANHIFKDEYNPDLGILKRSANIQSIREVDEDLAYIERKNDKFVNYFLKKNPGFADGEELVCLAEFSLDNIKPFIKKILTERIST